MIARVLIFAVCGALTIVETYGQSDLEWMTWKLVHQKMYSGLNSELLHRHVWEKNYRLVQEHNANAEATFTMELNYLADQEPSMHGLKVHMDEPHLLFEPHLNDVPDAWDWRKRGAVGPVQDQGQMGNVVSIVATECVDSFHFIRTGQMVSTSVGEMQDCCARTPIASDHIFQCVHDIGGLCSSGAYPKSTGVCRNSTCQAVATVNGGKKVPPGDEASMKAAVYTTPVFAVVDASHPSFQLYKAGTYVEPKCSPSMLDHALQVVGYGSSSGVDYWICKNSWGVSWGMQGYINIARNKGNMCGIASFTIYPV